MNNKITAKDPKNVTVSGEVFELYYTVSASHSRSWAFMMVDGFPLISIDMIYKQIYQHSIERAEMALKSFRENNHQWFYYPDTAYGTFESVDIDSPAPKGLYDEPMPLFKMEMVDNPAFKVEIYTTDIFHQEEPNKKGNWSRFTHAFVTNEDGISFVLFDEGLIKEALLRFNQRKRTPSKITSVSHGVSPELTGEA